MRRTAERALVVEVVDERLGRRWRLWAVGMGEASHADEERGRREGRAMRDIESVLVVCGGAVRGRDMAILSVARDIVKVRVMMPSVRSQVTRKIERRAKRASNEDVGGGREEKKRRL